jgi:ligand-binding SRPBCC domain-containing protein
MVWLVTQVRKTMFQSPIESIPEFVADSDATSSLGDSWSSNVQIVQDEAIDEALCPFS